MKQKLIMNITGMPVKKHPLKKDIKNPCKEASDKLALLWQEFLTIEDINTRYKAICGILTIMQSLPVYTHLLIPDMSDVSLMIFEGVFSNPSIRDILIKTPVTYDVETT